MRKKSGLLQMLAVFEGFHGGRQKGMTMSKQESNGFKPGEIVTLDDGREYVIVGIVQMDGTQYITFMTTTKPAEIKMGAMLPDGSFRNVTDKREKIAVLAMLKAQHDEADQ